MPKIIKGNCHSDQRGSLYYNNDFNSSEVKRIYFIVNETLDFIRGWQGHQIEQRWFSAVRGSFKIAVISIDNWQKPSVDSMMQEFILDDTTLDVLWIPQGHITSIQALEPYAKLMAMSDYNLGEINDEYRLDINYFKNK